jgi:hypothetical protein
MASRRRKTITADDGPSVRPCFRITVSDMELLEEEKARRRRSGGRVRGEADLSALVREAIRRTFGKPGKGKA